VTVHVLTTADHDGAKYVITGPESITHAGQVRIIGEAIGRDVRWEDLPPETAREQLPAAWGNPAFVDARLKAWATFVDSPERVTLPRVTFASIRPSVTFSGRGTS
jgi:uncharacterized protein YbjT (DUF2867 family)